MSANQFPHTPLKASCTGLIPSDEQCFELWKKYQMFSNIRQHSLLVAQIATFLAQRAYERNWPVLVQAVRASALLHDLGKTYAIRFGGNHSQLGAAVVMYETKNPALAQAVIHHIYWPGVVDLVGHFMPLSIIYADKRVKHDQIVSLEERFEDLFDRYGTYEELRAKIKMSFEQAQCIETELGFRLEVDFHAYPFDRRWLVQ
ncbi:MAG TPA: HD domain-containing protein [Desulfohalobiaceae bacterium]|nr:HD domain-containing protein [Desulfohalobiaceae bacterium]